MRIWAISDSHGHHWMYRKPTDKVDVVIFTGDESNARLPHLNEAEFMDWLHWYKNLDIEHKLYIPGNHSTFVYHEERLARDLLQEAGITWMHMESTEIAGIKFWGCGVSPTYGDWVYTVNRNKMHKYWEQIPEDTQVLITHSPPRYVLDSVIGRDGGLVAAGCNSLAKAVRKHPNIVAHVFGHIHSNKYGVKNHGLLHRDGIQFANCSAVEDRNYEAGIIHHGIVIEIC